MAPHRCHPSVHMECWREASSQWAEAETERELQRSKARGRAISILMTWGIARSSWLGCQDAQPSYKLSGWQLQALLRVDSRKSRQEEDQFVKGRCTWRTSMEPLSASSCVMGRPVSSPSHAGIPGKLRVDQGNLIRNFLFYFIEIWRLHKPINRPEADPRARGQVTLSPSPLLQR